MRIENAGTNGLLLRWDPDGYQLFRTGSKVVVHCSMNGAELEAEGNIARVEYGNEYVDIGVRDVVWFR